MGIMNNNMCNNTVAGSGNTSYSRREQLEGSSSPRITSDNNHTSYGASLVRGFVVHYSLATTV